MTENSITIILLLFLTVTFLAWLVSTIKRAKIRREQKRQEKKKKDTSQRRYVSKKMKDYILERDNETCQICGISKGLLDSYAEGLGDYLLLEIDHIKPVASGGRGDDEGNLQVLCWRCNRRKSGNKTNKEVTARIDYGASHLK